MRPFSVSVLLAISGSVLTTPGRSQPAPPTKPNILVILADDIGYGDLSSYGATRLKTPNVDRVAAQGVRFTSGYTPSATCTPTRYSLIAGEYAWRKKGTGVLPGDANLVVDTSRLTLPQMLKLAGYRTGVVGKWHLGLGDKPIDWNQPIAPGPKEVGFDESFILPATGDRTPTVYLRNGKVENHDPADPITVNYKEKVGTDPTGKENPDQLKMKLTQGHDFTIVNGVSRIGWMSGGKKARWVDEEMADTFVREGKRFLESSKGKPFFLYFATHSIHVPRVPHPRFVGKSGMGPRGDAILEFDWQVGELTKKLAQLGLEKNTLVLISSDNGPVLDDGYADQAVELLGDHKPAGPLKGGKYSMYEGGTRVPFIVRWPEAVKPGTSGEIVSLIDLCASFAHLTGTKLPDNAAPDSHNVMDALMNSPDAKGREHIVVQAQRQAIRKGKWKYIPPGTAQGQRMPQLFDLDADLGEEKNLADQFPETVKELDTLLNSIKQNPVSRR